MIIRPLRTKLKLEGEQDDRREESEDELAAALHTNESKKREVDQGKENNEPSMSHEVEQRPELESDSDHEDEDCLGSNDYSVQRPSSSRRSESAVTAVLEPHIRKQSLPARQPIYSQTQVQKKETKTSNGRKIKAEVHANYRALRIPNKGSKRKARMGVRFGRRGR